MSQARDVRTTQENNAFAHVRAAGYAQPDVKGMLLSW